MRPDDISQMSQLPMPSKLNSLSTEGEAEVTKDEGVLQVNNTQVEVRDNKTIIKISKVTNNSTRI
jgi:hypothetical protein